jgi:ubiquitin-conjugating enzyme E2 Q
MEGSVSTGSYAQASGTCWRNSACIPSACVALAEIVNLPNQFVSRNPFLVVAQTEWILCRYLLVRQNPVDSAYVAPPQISLHNPHAQADAQPVPDGVSFVRMDPTFKTTLAGKPIAIPIPDARLDERVRALGSGGQDIVWDTEDEGVFSYDAAAEAAAAAAAAAAFTKQAHGKRVRAVTSKGGATRLKSVEAHNDQEDYDDSWAYDETADALIIGDEARGQPGAQFSSIPQPPADDWAHDDVWLRQCIEHVLPPPMEASPGAARNLQRELKAMIKEQEQAPSLRELGWYLPPWVVEESENLFQWIVEIHSFDPGCISPIFYSQSTD